jgi:V/A-type H+-transporting ATPase subunit E
VGYPELLRVLEEEAARETRALRDGAEREAARILAEARAAADAARAALLERERAACEARRRAEEERIALDRERVLLRERRRLLEEVRAEAARRLAAAGSPALDARLLAEVLPEVGPGAFEVVGDPGAEEALRAALAAIDPGAAARGAVRAAEARRGGVLVVVGRRVLDDTLPARLERAWPDLEPEVAAILEGNA